MPNWCTNTLSICAESKEELEDFLIKVVEPKTFKPKQEPLWFSSIRPVPEGLAEKLDSTQTIEVLRRINLQYDTSDLTLDMWAWKLVNWGTKSEAQCYEPKGSGYQPQAIFVDDSGRYRYDFMFDTAWSPPEAWVKYASSQFQNLRFLLCFEELGNAFTGLVAYSQGSEVGRLDTQPWEEEGDNEDEDSSKHVGYCSTLTEEKVCEVFDLIYKGKLTTDLLEVDAAFKEA